MDWLTFIYSVVAALRWPAFFSFALIWIAPIMPAVGSFLVGAFKNKNLKSSIDMLGVKASLETQITSLNEAPGDPVTEMPSSAPALPLSRVAAQLHRDSLEKYLENVPQPDRYERVITIAAFLKADAWNEWLLNRIFGSQFNLLERSNAGVSSEIAQEIYKLAAAKFPEIYQNYGYEPWLGFLKNGEFVTEQNGIILITPHGQDFLHYVIYNKLSVNKPG